MALAIQFCLFKKKKKKSKEPNTPSRHFLSVQKNLNIKYIRNLIFESFIWGKQTYHKQVINIFWHVINMLFLFVHLLKCM